MRPDQRQNRLIADAIQMATVPRDMPGLLMGGPCDHRWLDAVPKGSCGVNAPTGLLNNFAYYEYVGLCQVDGDETAKFTYAPAG